MLQDLINLDHRLFHFINQVFTNSYFDWFFPFITDFRNTWWILLAFLAIWIFKCRKSALKIILGCVLCVAAADQISSHLIKEIVRRDRPTQTLKENEVRLLTYKHTSYSFPSSHSTNTFAVATYITLVAPIGGLVAFPLAFLIAYSRVYVGVHFPADVLGGALLGASLAYIVRRLILKIDSLIN